MSATATNDEVPRERTPPEVKPTTAAEALAMLRREPGKLYAVLDPAQDEEILGVLRRSGQPAYSLYDGWAAVHYRTQCPYLVPLRKQGRLVEQLVEQGWLRAWGLFFTSDRELKDIRRHLRRLLKVRAANGETVLCRFYDPLTMELFLTDPNREYDPWMYGDVVRSYLLESHLEELLTLRRAAPANDDLRWPVELTRDRDERFTYRRRAFFIDQIERFVVTKYGERTVRLPLGEGVVHALPRPMLRHMIDRGVRRAAAHNLNDARDQLAFVTLMFMKAPNFDEHLVIREALDRVHSGVAMMPVIVERTDDRVWREVREDYDPAAWELGLHAWGGIS